MPKAKNELKKIEEYGLLLSLFSHELENISIDIFKLSGNNNRAFHRNGINTAFDLTLLDEEKYKDSKGMGVVMLHKASLALKQLCKKFLPDNKKTDIAHVNAVICFNFLENAPKTFLDQNIPYKKTENVRLKNALQARAGIKTYLDLKLLGIDEFESLPNIGAESIRNLNLLIKNDLKTFSKIPQKLKQEFLPLEQLKRKLSDVKPYQHDKIREEDTQKYKNIQSGLRNCVLAYSRFALSDRQHSMFVNKYESDFSLSKIGASYGVTGERVRQIVNKSLAKTCKGFVSATKSNESDIIKSFYCTLNDLSLNELLRYFSFSRLKNDIDYCVLKYIFKNCHLNEGIIPSVEFKDGFDAYEKKADPETNISEEDVKNINNTLFSEFEKIVLLAFLECSDHGELVNLSQVDRYLVGRGPAKKNGLYHGFYPKLDRKQNVVRDVYSKYRYLGILTKEHKAIEISRGRTLRSIVYKVNTALLEKTKLIGRFENLSNDLDCEMELEDFKVLECIKGTKKRGSIIAYVDCLHGKRTNRVIKRGFDAVDCFGCLKNKETQAKTKRRIEHLIDKGFLYKTASYHPLVRITNLGSLLV